jgi:hypothetical protein
MKELFLTFWKSHGERHVFAIEAFAIIGLLWWWMPNLHDQLTGAAYMVLTLVLKEIRSNNKGGN